LFLPGGFEIETEQGENSDNEHELIAAGVQNTEVTAGDRGGLHNYQVAMPSLG
jgi:hypothetical protein